MDIILYLLTTLFLSQAIIIMITKAGKCIEANYVHVPCKYYTQKGM